MGESWIRRLYSIYGDGDDVNGVYSPNRNSIRTINENESQFGETLVVERSPVIELNSSYGTSLLRDKQTTTNSGTISANSNGEIVISTGETANSQALLDSSEVGRYIPGYGAELGAGVRFATLPTGNQEARWGGQDENDENGFFFGYDADGLFVARRNDGTDTKIYQSDFNIDTIDGNGKSGYNLDLTKGNIFQIQFTWYGYGQIVFGILGLIRNKQTFIACHEISNQDFTTTSVQSPNLKVFNEVLNNGDSSDLTMFVGGRQYSVIGRYFPKYRFTADFRGTTNTSTTVIPLVSFRRKSGFGDRSVKLQSFDIKAISNDVYVQIFVGGSLTGASFGTPTGYIAAETALESDKSATAITGGTCVWGQMFASGQNQNTATLATSDVDLDIPNGDIVTLTARTVTGTGSVRSAFRLREEWVLIFALFSFIFQLFNLTGIA